MSGALKITARCYRITARANITAMLWRLAKMNLAIRGIEWAGEFTMPKFHGINIQATGQNIITLGDGNQINAQFSELGQALVELRDAITASDAPEMQKMDLVADIETVQTQLAKSSSNRTVVSAAWEAVKAAAAISGCAALVEKVSNLITRFLP